MSQLVSKRRGGLILAQAGARGVPRLPGHLQLQVVLKPSPDDVQQMYLRSLERLGIAAADHDIRFEEDNWESPTLGAWGVGWQVVMDGMEITQFTYFQQAGGIDLAPISAEITYGLERIAMFLNKVDSIYDVPWTESLTYGQVRRTEEEELSRYYFEVADVELAALLLDRWEAEARAWRATLSDLLARLEPWQPL